MRLFFLELRRALKEKNFWIVIIFLIAMSILVTLPNFLPEKLAVLHDSTKQTKLSYNAVDILKFYLSSRIMTSFIVLFPVIIYAHSFVDDMNTKYINHIVLRIGFKNYFINKFLTCAFLGGLSLTITSICAYSLYNIIYTNSANNNFHFVFNLVNYKINFYNPTEYLIFINIILFFFGAIYASVGFLISLYTDNKMIIYGLSTLSLRLYEDIIYLLSHFLGFITGKNYTVYYFTYSIFSNLGEYSDWKLIFVHIALFVIIVQAIKTRYIKISLEYIQR